MTFKATVEQDAVAVLEQMPEVDGKGMVVPAEIKFATFRRGVGTFFKEFPEFRAKLQINEVLAMTQSESEGNLTITLAFR